MYQVVAYKRLKRWKIIKTMRAKSGRSRLRWVAFTRDSIKRLWLEKFGVLDGGCLWELFTHWGSTVVGTYFPEGGLKLLL